MKMNLKNSFKKGYYRFLSAFSGLKPELSSVDIKNFEVSFNEDVFECPAPSLNKLRETYVLIRKLLFHPEININIMESFKSLLKWKELNLHYSTAVRDYPLGFETNVEKISYCDLHLIECMKIHEEILQVLPYVRKVSPANLFRIPLTKKPIYKSYFSKDEMKLIREKAGEQNKTGWSNIEIFEIYDKFNYNLFSSIKQMPGSKNLECQPNSSSRDKPPEVFYYLVIGRKRDSGDPIKAIINPADIKKE